MIEPDWTFYTFIIALLTYAGITIADIKNLINKNVAEYGRLILFIVIMILLFYRK